MDLFKFTPVSYETMLEHGDAINKLTSVMWTERYREPGEFQLKAQLSTGLREFLPLGTLISHKDTYEVMIVENHEITEEKQEDPTLIVTGRSFEAFLENRVVGVNQARASSTLAEYILLQDYTWNQATKLINDHIYNTQTPNDALYNVQAVNMVPISAGTIEERTIDRGNVLDKLDEILAIDDIGVRTIRRNYFGLVGSNTWTRIEIFRGTDLSNKVIFSWKSGDLDSAEYLFSDKPTKNAALILGRYVYAVVDNPAYTKYDRRFMMVDGSDLDGNLSAPPTGAALTTILNKMRTRGRQALGRQNRINLSRTDVSDTTQYVFRKDYNIGDIVSLDGNFGQITKMRVVEYVEIEDENGTSGHPTLSIKGSV